MTTTTTGTLIDGVVKLDQQVSLPNHSRVTVRLSSIGDSALTPEETWQILQQQLENNAIGSDGEHFSRDELHERS